MEKRKIILALAGAALGVCICSAIYQMDQVKGPAVELADFTDIPYQEGLNRMSEDCVYDLDFDGRDDIFWFDQNYPPDRDGEIPFVVGCKIGDLRVRLDSLDVKELHAFVLADLDQSDQRCDLIISMTQGADNARKTLVVNIPRKGMDFPWDTNRPPANGFRYLKANYWHLREINSKNQQNCLLDGLYQGINGEGALLIGDLRLKPGRKHTLLELKTEETA